MADTKNAEEIKLMESKKSPIDDYQCPICLEILIEPVKMPCNHELCLKCFEQHLQETSLTCPICRQRVSNWARNARREKRLVDVERWTQIRRLFPNEIHTRLSNREQ